MHYWLSKAVLEWSPKPSGGTIVDDLERLRRPHAILAHAERMLSNSESEFFIADSISALKRAINSRLRHLEEIYEFREWFPKQVGSLERLEQVGLALPFLIKQLFDLRNEIEHNDAPVPSVARARELVDITWYFLCTTDAACKLIPDEVMLNPAREDLYRDPELWLQISVLPGQRGRFELVGWLSLDLLSETEQPGFLQLEVEVFKSKQASSSTSEDSWQADYSRNEERKDDERFVVAQADVPPDVHIQIWRLAFETRSAY